LIRMNSLKHVDSHMGDLISDLQKLIQQPSVSAKNEGIEECAKLVQTLLKSSGLKSEILRLKKGCGSNCICRNTFKI